LNKNVSIILLGLFFSLFIFNTIGTYDNVVILNAVQFKNYDIVNNRAQTIFTPNGTAICTNTGDQSSAVMCCDGSGGAIIAWVDNLGANNNIRAQKVSSTGGLEWDLNGTVICNASNNQNNPKIICDGVGGAIIVWRDYRNGAFSENPDIYAQRVDSNGNPLWGQNGTAICNTLDQQEDHEICTDGAGGAFIIWRDNRTGNYVLFCQRINSLGTLIFGNGTPGDFNGTLICNAPNVKYNPQICEDGLGGAIIAWRDGRNFATTHYDIYAQKINSTGTIQWGNGTPSDLNGTLICNASNSQGIPRICSAGAGSAIISWKDARGADNDIYAQKVDSSGNKEWTNNGKLICNAINDQFDLQICCDSAGGAILTWNDERVGEDIYAQKINSIGTILWTGNGTLVCHDTHYQFAPKICCDGAGGAVIIWEDYRSVIIGDLYAQKIDSAGNNLWTDNGTVICSGKTNLHNYIICCDGAGSAVISWMDERNGNKDIFAQKITCQATSTANDPLFLILTATFVNEGSPLIGWLMVGVAIGAGIIIIIIYYKRK